MLSPSSATNFLQKFGKELGKDVRGVAPEAMAVLERYHWPGNIRELENVLERAIVLGAGEMLGVDSLPESVRRERPVRGLDSVDIPEDGLDLGGYPGHDRRVATSSARSTVRAVCKRRRPSCSR